MHDAAGRVLGRTALMLALAAGRKADAAVELLLARGASVRARDVIEGWLPLHHAAAADNWAAVRLLVKSHRAWVDARAANGATALAVAAAAGCHEACLELLEVGADANALDKSSRPPLALAVANRRWATAEALLRHADATPLSAAAAVGLDRALSAQQPAGAPPETGPSRIDSAASAPAENVRGADRAAAAPGVAAHGLRCQPDAAGRTALHDLVDAARECAAQLAASKAAGKHRAQMEAERDWMALLRVLGLMLRGPALEPGVLDAVDSGCGLTAAGMAAQHGSELSAVAMMLSAAAADAAARQRAAAYAGAPAALGRKNGRLLNRRTSTEPVLGSTPRMTPATAALARALSLSAIVESPSASGRWTDDEGKGGSGRGGSGHGRPLAVRTGLDSGSSSGESPLASAAASVVAAFLRNAPVVPEESMREGEREGEDEELNDSATGPRGHRVQGGGVARGDSWTSIGAPSSEAKEVKGGAFAEPVDDSARGNLHSAVAT